MKTMNKTVLSIALLLLMFSCSPGGKRATIDVRNIEIEEVRIGRYGKTIFELDTAILQQELKRIKPEFKLFLDGDLDDPETLARMKGFVTDELLIEANRDCQQKFSDLRWLEKELTDVLMHYKYHFPEQLTPKVYTYVSGFDFEFRTQYFNDNLLIALDMYLGPEYPAYQKLGIPQYVIRKFQARYLTRDCAFEMGQSKINYQKPGNELLDLMINEGKLLWFVKALIPNLEEGVLFDYSARQLEWVRQNEGMVWAFMIENEVLYSAEQESMQKFILDAPFTSYFGKESPPRLGAYLGYRIVDHYMQRNREVTLQEFMQEYDPQKVLKGSRYKPE